MRCLGALINAVKISIARERNKPKAMFRSNPTYNPDI